MDSQTVEWTKRPDSLGRMQAVSTAIQHRDAILDRVRAGELLIAIAADYGVTPAVISQQLSNDPEYIDARTVGMAAKIETIERQIEAAPDALSLARAEKLGHHLRWRAEREFSHLYGQRTHTTVEHVGDLGDKLRRARERLIGHGSTSETASTNAALLPADSGNPPDPA